MSAPLRGDVWLVDFGEPVGREQGWARPAVVVSADPLNASRAAVVIVVPMTTTARGLPSHVEVDAQGSGLDQTSYAKAEDVKSVSVQRLLHRLGVLPVERTMTLDIVLRRVLAL